MGADVTFDGEESELIDKGQLVFLGVVLYNAAEDKLEVLVSGARSPEEFQAILAKFIKGAHLKLGGRT